MKEKKSTWYYEAVAGGPHAFFVKAMEKITAQCPDGIRCGSMIFGKLNGISKLALELKAKTVPFLDWIPQKGLLVSPKSHKVGRQRVLTKECCYEFVGLTKNPVYVAGLNLLGYEYGSLSVVTSTIIVAKNETQIEKFMDAYTKADQARVRGRSVVLNQRGSEMKGFRKMSWMDIVLPGSMRDDIRTEIEEFFTHEAAYKKYGLEWRRGIILAGDPGNGKTAICRAVASTSKVPIIYCVLGEHDTFGFLGNIKATLDRYAPCVVIFEDADSLGSDESVRSSFLNMLDGLFSSSGILVIASSNCPGKLDVALTGRPSRFDSFYHIPNPGAEEREKLLKMKVGKLGRKIHNNVWQKVVVDTEGLSSAAIQEVAVSSLLSALRKGSPIEADHLYSAVQKVRKHMDMAKHGIEKTQKGEVGFKQLEKKLDLL
jgi:SpoVK/Ycf46/Vps4 family AAA+-type ATPase